MKRLLLLIITLILLPFLLSAQNSIRSTHRWEFLKVDLGGVWEAVQTVKPGVPESLPIWGKVTLPHCFNAYNAVADFIMTDVCQKQFHGKVPVTIRCDNSYAWK